MRESRNLEYKEGITNTFLKTVSAFANYGTGVIKFGVRDNGEFVGVDDARNASLIIENKINDSISPQVNYYLDIDGKTNVISLTVMEGIDKPYFYKSKAYKRNDTATIEVGGHELKRLILEGQNKGFEDVLAQNQDLAFSKLEEELLASMGLEKVTRDTLITLELYAQASGYNQAAALLADKNDFPGIDIVRFGENINIILDRETFAKVSILEQFDQAMMVYRKYYQYEEIKGDKRVRRENIPEEAFRETLANAIIHRAWDLDAHIRIAMYEDRLEVISPGGLPSGVTEREYLDGQISILRNPIIANVFFRLHHVERFGTGIMRIVNAYAASEVKPRFAIYENSIKVILPIVQRKVDLPEDEKLVYSFFRPNRMLSSSELVSLTNFGKSKLINILKTLEDKGYIRVVGQGRATRYTI